MPRLPAHYTFEHLLYPRSAGCCLHLGSVHVPTLRKVMNDQVLAYSDFGVNRTPDCTVAQDIPPAPEPTRNLRDHGYVLFVVQLVEINFSFGLYVQSNNKDEFRRKIGGGSSGKGRVVDGGVRPSIQILHRCEKTFVSFGPIIFESLIFRSICDTGFRDVIQSQICGFLAVDSFETSCVKERRDRQSRRGVFIVIPVWTIDK